MCCNRDCGCLLAAVVSIFLGIIIGVLFFFGFIPTIIPGIWIAFGIAVLSFIGVTIIATMNDREVMRCLCQYGRCLLTGIVGTILTTIVALVIELTIGEILPTIIIAILGFFFILLIIAIVLFIRCLIELNCHNN